MEMHSMCTKTVFIPPLQMVDDIVTISTCGMQAITMNACLNAKIESKKLIISHEKSFQMHVGKRNELCESNLKVQKKTFLCGCVK